MRNTIQEQANKKQKQVYRKEIYYKSKEKKKTMVWNKMPIRQKLEKTIKGKINELKTYTDETT